MVESKYRVKINLYDLTQGMAKVMSPMLLGKQIEGVWHTGVVVYGIEYYYGGGICTGQPEKTPYGHPVQVIDHGETEIPKEFFQEFLREIEPRFTPEKYDLFKNNCNNFTDECSHFLLSKGIPEHITGLPEEILKTPMGQMLKPIIDQMQNQVMSQSGQTQLFPAAFEGSGSQSQQLFPQQRAPLDSQAQLVANLGAVLQQTQPAAGTLNTGGAQPAQIDLKKTIQIDDVMDFFTVAESHDPLIVMFYSNFSGPSNMIKPFFCTQSEEYAASGIKFYLVDAQKHVDLAQQFGIQAYPTFVCYQNGQVRDKFAGANQTKLKEKIEALKAK